MQILDEQFAGPGLDGSLHWLHPPKRWVVDAASSLLVVEPEANTDFWQKTHYGFEADNGHFLFTSVFGDFLMTTHVRFHPVHQYDQAGLMVRRNADSWLKTSVEYEGDHPQKLGAVVTNSGYSDWSVQDFDRARWDVFLRILRAGSDLTVEHSADGESWSMLRLAHLHDIGESLDCGLYACSPKGEGFRAEFEFLRIDQP